MARLLWFNGTYVWTSDVRGILRAETDVCCGSQREKHPTVGQIHHHAACEIRGNHTWNETTCRTQPYIHGVSSCDRRCVALLAVSSEELDAERKESERLRHALLLIERTKVRLTLYFVLEAKSRGELCLE